MEAAHIEIQSFISKYFQLKCVGFSACLNLNCVAGRSFVTLSTELGLGQPTYFHQPYSSTKPSRSRLRRRKRCENFRTSDNIDFSAQNQASNEPLNSTTAEETDDIRAQDYLPATTSEHQQIEFGEGIIAVLENPLDPTTEEMSVPVFDYQDQENSSQQSVEPTCNKDEFLEEDILDKPITALTRGEFRRLMDDFCSNFKLDLQQPLLPLSQSEH